MDQDVESPREKRNSVIVRAVMHLPGYSSHSERRVRNLSLSGACIEHGGELRTGMTVLLEIGTISDLAAEVVWVTEKLAGLRFDRHVDLEAARKPRASGSASAVKAGWINDIRNAYGR